MRKLGIEMWLVRMVMAIYATTQVRLTGGLRDDFPVKVGVLQGSVLSPLLLIIVVKALSQD